MLHRIEGANEEKKTKNLLRNCTKKNGSILKNWLIEMWATAAAVVRRKQNEKKAPATNEIHFGRTNGFIAWEIAPVLRTHSSLWNICRISATHTSNRWFGGARNRNQSSLRCRPTWPMTRASQLIRQSRHYPIFCRLPFCLLFFMPLRINSAATTKRWTNKSRRKCLVFTHGICICGEHQSEWKT